MTEPIDVPCRRHRFLPVIGGKGRVVNLALDARVGNVEVRRATVRRGGGLGVEHYMGDLAVSRKDEVKVTNPLRRRPLAITIEHMTGDLKIEHGRLGMRRGGT